MQQYVNRREFVEPSLRSLTEHGGQEKVVCGETLYEVTSFDERTWFSVMTLIQWTAAMSIYIVKINTTLVDGDS